MTTLLAPLGSYNYHPIKNQTKQNIHHIEVYHHPANLLIHHESNAVVHKHDGDELRNEDCPLVDGGELLQAAGLVGKSGRVHILAADDWKHHVIEYLKTSVDNTREEEATNVGHCD